VGASLARLVLVVAVVLVAVAQSGPLTTAVASAGTGCRGPVGAGCVEVAITSTDGLPVVAPATVRELQMNVCHSGVASCFEPDDRSTIEAAGMVTRFLPTVVTLNEICAADIVDTASPIPAAMARIARRARDATVFAVFAPAVNRYTGEPFRCADGDLYGIGLIGRGTVGTVVHHVYRDQLASSDEERVAVCAPVDGYDICTTHLESDNGAVALRQCRELMSPTGYVSQVRARTTRPPTMVAGDFNLRDVGACTPSTWAVTGDGVVQHVAVTGLRLTATRTVATHHTDHPALVVDLSHG
jgi:hypothetical protein